LQVFPTKFVAKSVYIKYFAKKLVAISCNFFFKIKICRYFLRKNF